MATDNVSNATINLIRGRTYKLVINAVGHPFWIQTVPGGYSSNNIYNSGITNNGIESGTIIFAVPNDAPDTLYYACQFHLTMRGTINITGTGAVAPTISSFNIPSYGYVAGGTFTIPQPVSNSPGTFSYTSSDPKIAKVVGDTVFILALGTTRIIATQAAFANYTSGNISADLVINKGTPATPSTGIPATTFTIPAQTFLVSGATFTIPQPSSTSPGAFSYASSNSNIASVSGNIVTILQAGTVTITATQAETALYTAHTTTATLVINKATTILTNFNIGTQTYSNGGTFTLSPPTSNRPGAFSYASTNTSIATVSGSTVTILQAGTVVIVATQTETTNHTASNIHATLIINKANPSVNFNIAAQTYSSFGTFTLTQPVSNSPGAFSYASSDITIASVVGTDVTILRSGTVIITATQTETTNYNAAIINATLTVNKAPPIITGFTIADRPYVSGDTFRLIEPSAISVKNSGSSAYLISNSTGAFSYTSSNSNIAIVSGDTVTVLQAGTVTITATQAASDNYASGSVTATFTIYKANPTITNFSINTQTYSRGGTFTIPQPSSNSPGSFSYASSDRNIATVAGNTVTILQAGTVTITASQAETTHYTSGTITASFTINKAVPSITNFTIGTRTYSNGGTFTLTQPTSNSPGGFSYAISDANNVASVSGSTVTILQAGTTTVTATQGESTNYLASSVTTSLVINKAIPIISDFSISNQPYSNGGVFTITQPTSNSPGTFLYEISNTNIASVSGNTVTMLQLGTVIVTATQAESINYASGSIVTPLTIIANAVNTSPIITNFNIPTQSYSNGGTFTLPRPTSNSLGDFSYTIPNTTIASVSGNIVTILGVGNATVIATQAANSNYDTGSISASLVINKSTPNITNFNIPTQTYSIGGTFTLTDPSSNNITGAFSYTSSDTNIATVSGKTVSILQAGAVTIRATQAETANYAAGSVNATLNINKATLTLANFSIANRPYSVNGTFTIIDPSSNNPGGFSYQSSDETVASISENNIVSILRAGGPVTITAIREESINYTSGTIAASFTINKAIPSITNFNIDARTYSNGSTFTLPQPSSNSPGSFSYESSNRDVASVSGNTVTMVQVGTVTITATQAETTNYATSNITALFTINSATLLCLTNPTVVNIVESAPDGNKYVLNNSTSYDSSIVYGLGNGTYVLQNIHQDHPMALLNSGLTNSITYSGDATKKLTKSVNGVSYDFYYGNITVRVNGNFNAVSIYGYNDGYMGGENLFTYSASCYIIPSPTITGFVVATRPFLSGGTFTLTKPTSNSTGAFSYTSSDPVIASVSGSTVTILQAGTVTITATQAATDSYAEGSVTATFTIVPTPDSVNIDEANVIDSDGNINVLVKWYPPNDGGYAITSYRIQYSLTNYIEYITKELILANTPSAFDPVTGQISYLITELTKGGKYQIRIAAVNSFGMGQYSDLKFAFPGTVPASLNSSTFEVYASRGSTLATVYWIKPYDGGYPIIKYLLRYRSITIDVVNKIPILSSIREPASAWTTPIEISANLQSTVVTNLSNGTYYQFQVAAVNDVGIADYNGPVVVKPGDIPGPFTANISTDFVYSINARNNGRIFLEWSPPQYDGGYDLENYVIHYKSSNDIYFTKRVIPLSQRDIPAGLRSTPSFSRNIVVDYYGDLSANPPIPIQEPLQNDVPYSIRIGVQNDVGIRWIPEREQSAEIYATIIPNTFSKPVLDLSATIADQTAKLSWTWNDASLNNGYPLNGAYPLDGSNNRLKNYFVVRYRPYNDLYWHQLVYPHAAEKLDVNSTLNAYSITLAETGRDTRYSNANPDQLFERNAYQGVEYNYTNAVRDVSVNVYNRLDPFFPPFQERQPLTNGLPYDFQVAAVNHILRGPDMGIAIGEYAQTRQTPGRVPDPPALFRIQRGSQQSTIFWNAPVSDGGYPVTTYRLRTRTFSVVNMIMSTGEFPLTNSVIYPTVASYNRTGVGVNSGNASIPTVISSRYTDPSGNETLDEEIITYPGSDRSATLPFGKFDNNELFDLALSAGNMLGYGPEVFITDMYSTKPYRPDPPENVTAQMIKSSEVNGGSGSLFLNWTTPNYAGGDLAVSYAYEIQYALTEASPIESNPDPVTDPNPVPDETWQALSSNQQMFSEYVSPSNTKLPNTLVSTAYSIFASQSGMIGDTFIRWVRIRSTAKTLGIGTGSLGDLDSLWVVCNVITLD
jgi:uncharacterized protein YjdB